MSSGYVSALGAHDTGGNLDKYGPIFPGFGASGPCKVTEIDSPVQLWEKKVHCLLGLLCKKGLLTVDEMRRGIETLPPSVYGNWSYYERWAASILLVSLERGTVTKSDVDKYLYGIDGNEPVLKEEAQLFKAGDYVRVKKEDSLPYAWPRPHLRTPGYVFGMVGQVEAVVGAYKNPELLAFNRPAPLATNYRVVFSQAHVWGAGYKGNVNDKVGVEIYQHWLLPATKEDYDKQEQEVQDAAKSASGHVSCLDQEKDKDHEHELGHDERTAVEQKAVDLEGPERPGERLAHALVKMLLGNGTLTNEELQVAMQSFDIMGKSSEGPRLVARAWTDPEFKARLLADGNSAAAELGINAANPHAYTKLVVVENTPKVHNVIVCTLCSCYPMNILGPSPSWYKSRQYRARVVREPRAVLAEFGTVLPDDVAVRVHDSTADCRYLVLPMRPAGTEGWDRERLQTVVTRDSMIGVTTLPPVTE